MGDADRRRMLCDWRRRHGFTQKEASQRMGRNYYTWCNYESGQRQVPDHLIRHIEDFDKLQRVLEAM